MQNWIVQGSFLSGEGRGTNLIEVISIVEGFDGADEEKMFFQLGWAIVHPLSTQREIVLAFVSLLFKGDCSAKKLFLIFRCCSDHIFGCKVLCDVEVMKDVLYKCKSFFNFVKISIVDTNKTQSAGVTYKGGGRGRWLVGWEMVGARCMCCSGEGSREERGSREVVI